MLKGRRWWYVVAFGLILVALTLPTAESRQIVLPFVCVWPLLIWSQLGNRETQHRTDQLVFSAAFIPAAALAFGVWSGGSKLFEVVYLLLWTLGPMNQMMAALGFPLVADQFSAFDYVGSSDAAVSEGIPLYYTVLTILLLALALIGRRRQLQV